MALNKDQILHADDLPRREVQTPEWGGSVFVRALTGDERDSYEGEMLGSDGTRKTDVTGFVPAWRCGPSSTRTAAASSTTRTLSSWARSPPPCCSGSSSRCWNCRA
jgi:hypothetical protein